jgi:hypothetical protein
MPKPNPVADLAAELVQTLQHRRDQGDGPLVTLAQVAAKLDPPPDMADVLKALKKKPFAVQLLAARPDAASPVVLAEDGDRLAASPGLLDYVLGQLYQPGKELHALPRVVAKVEKRLQPAFTAVLTQQIADNALPSLAGIRVVRDKPHLYLKAFPPPLTPDQALAEMLVQTLQGEKQAGAYPPTLRQLLVRAQAENAPELAKALAHKAFKTQVLVAVPKHLDAPIALTIDLAPLADSPSLLEIAVGLLSTEKKPLHPIPKVVAKVDARLRESFAAAVNRRVAGDLPPSVAVVRVKEVPHLCLRAYLPRLAPEVELAGKLLRTLEEYRQRGDYPMTLAQLHRSADPQASADMVAKALAAKSFKPHAVLALPDDPNTPVALKGDAERLARWPGMMEMLLTKMRTADNQAFLPADLAKRLGKELRVPFAAAVEESVQNATLPQGVGSVRIKAKPYLFLLGAAGSRPAAVPAPAPLDFATRFDEAFQEIDRQTGSHNFVSLVDVRRAMPLERTDFEEGLRRLRQAGRYTLSGAEGRHGITDEERAAGIQENGAVLLYVSQRRTY